VTLVINKMGSRDRRIFLGAFGVVILMNLHIVCKINLYTPLPDWLHMYLLCDDKYTKLNIFFRVFTSLLFSTLIFLRQLLYGISKVFTKTYLILFKQSISNVHFFYFVRLGQWFYAISKVNNFVF
jgi:hypothetical protein